METDGEYAFRFTGFSMANSIPHHLVGVGVMKLENGLLTGEQKSTIARLRGQDAAFKETTYTLDGTYKIVGAIGEAIVKFTEKSDADDAQVMTSSFQFVAAGAGRFWLTSGKAKITSAGHKQAAEVLSGEATRIA